MSTRTTQPGSRHGLEANERQRQIEDGFAHLHAVDPALAQLIDRCPDYDPDAWRAELPEMDLFGCLLFQIIGQQISVRAANAILARLSVAFGGRIPNPDQVLTLDAQWLRDAGLSWRKAATVLELAERFAAGELSENNLAILPDDEIVAELTTIHGIGPWTVHGALLIALHRPDVVATGDIMLRNTIRNVYDLDHLPTEQEVRDIAEPWHPHGSLGVNLIFAAAELGVPVASEQRATP
jgi:DNA-3-methyladenine glycosylase II